MILGVSAFHDPDLRTGRVLDYPCFHRQQHHSRHQYPHTYDGRGASV